MGAYLQIRSIFFAAALLLATVGAASAQSSKCPSGQFVNSVGIYPPTACQGILNLPTFSVVTTQTTGLFNYSADGVSNATDWLAPTLISYIPATATAHERAAFAVVGISPGGQADGDALSDSAIHCSETKLNFLTSSATGEVDCGWAYANQGNSGSSSAFLFTDTRVNNTGTAFGNTSTEARSQIVDSSDNVLLQGAALTAYGVTGVTPTLTPLMVECEQGTCPVDLLLTTEDLSGGGNSPTATVAIGLSASRSLVTFLWDVDGSGNEFAKTATIGATNPVVITSASGTPTVGPSGANTNVIFTSGPGTTGLLLLEAGSSTGVVYFGQTGSGTNWGAVSSTGIHSNNGLEVGSPTGGMPAAGVVNATGYQANGTAGISKNCSAMPTTIQFINGLMTALSGGTCS